MKILALIAAVALQSCTPVFAQSEASKGQPHPEATQTKKTTEEPGTWEKVKEKTGNAVEEAIEYGSEKSQSIGRTLGAARLRRQDSTWTITGNYALFEMWTLNKYGLTVGYNKNESTTYEFEYMRGSLGFGYFGIDIGSIEEQRFGLNWRTYGQRNSFSFVTGVYYNILNMHLGSDALATVAGTQRAKVDLLEIQTVGLHWGIGNRWQTKGGFVWGADWVAINLPIWIVKQEHPFIDATTDEKYREDAKDALRFFRRIPEIAALKIQLGFSW